jgi:hypothetical protein
MSDNGLVAGGRLTDQITLGVLAASVPRDAVDDAVAAAGKQARRRDGKLPPHVMVYFAMACATRRERCRVEVKDRHRRVVAAA